MTAKRFLIALGIVLLILVLDACAAPVRAGVVVGKNYEAAEIDYDTKCVRKDSTGKCVEKIQVPDHDPECFELVLREADREGTVCVPERTWESAAIGSRYPA